MKISSYPSIYTLGHRYVENIFQTPVLVEEKIDGCVTLDTPVLTTDLRYVPAGFLQVGDSLIGFEDTLNDPRLCVSMVTAARPIKKQCVTVVTTKGDINVSTDHPFLVRQLTNNNGKIWVKAKDLKKGMSIMYAGYWNEEESWEAGYLAGQFDGEGSLVRSNNSRVLSYYQKIGPELSLVERLIKKRGFVFSLDARQRRADWKRVGAIVFRHNWLDILKFLGIVRPQRLIADSAKIWEGSPLNSFHNAEVITLKNSRQKLVMGLSTSSKTYIAKGFLSHNSQFSFRLNEDGSWTAKSKGRELLQGNIDKMFQPTVNTFVNLLPILKPGWTYRGEAMNKPKHNTIAYSRCPVGNIMLFDVDDGLENYLSRQDKEAEAKRLELEIVPVLYEGTVESFEQIKGLMDTESVLGGSKIEGMVIKNYSLFGIDKKVLMGKFVSEAFKEKHRTEWKNTNPGKGDVIKQLTDILKHENRWLKAIQHFKDNGMLKQAPEDIGPLMAEIAKDIFKEEKDFIQTQLFKWAWKILSRSCVRGFPEFYKDWLLKQQFEEKKID